VQSWKDCSVIEWLSIARSLDDGTVGIKHLQARVTTTCKEYSAVMSEHIVLCSVEDFPSNTSETGIYQTLSNDR